MKKILSMLAVAAMAFTACTTDITEDVVKDKVNAGYTFEFTVDQEVSRAFMDDDVTIKFEEGDVFGVYINPADGNTAATKNAKGTLGANGVVTVTGLPAEVVAGDKLMAYYPYSTQNDGRAATDIILTIQHVQMQNAADKVNLKHMPMVSETTIAEATDNSLYFRPVAAIVKFNIYSSNEEYQRAVISNIRFNAEKHEDVTACNYVSGHRSGFDLTNISHDGEIEVKKEAVIGGKDNQWKDTTAPSDLQLAYRVNGSFGENWATVGTDGSDASSVYLCIWPGNYGGENYNSNNYSYVQVFTNKGYFQVKMAANYEFGRAMIRPFSVDLNNNYNFKASIGMKYIYEHAHVSGLVTEQMMNEDLIVVASASETKNLELNTFKTWNTVSTHKAAAYVQTLDGKYGARLNFYYTADNTLKRGDKIRLSLIGTTAYDYARESKDKAATSDTHCVIIGGVRAANILTKVSGCEDEIVTKEKTLAELTDQDIYTEVTLKNMEVVVKKTVKTGTAENRVLGSEGYNHPAPWTTGYESNFNAAVKTELLPTMLQDKDNNAIFALINPNCGDWRRNVGVPQGVGSIKGLLVHETSKVIGDIADGNMGKYQFRPYDETSFSGISTAEENATKVIAMWSPNKGTKTIGAYYFTCEDTGCLGTKEASGYQLGSTNAADECYKAGIVPQNKMWATHGQLTDGSALFYSSNRDYINVAINYLYDSAKTTNINNGSYPLGIVAGVKSTTTAKNTSDAKSESPGTTITFTSSTAGFYEWNNGSWTGKTNGFIVEFPGSQATGKTAISFSLSPNAAKSRQTVFGYPLYWKVETSVDGGNTWTACTNAITGNENGHFDMHVYNFYINNCGYHHPLTGVNEAATTSNVDLYYEGMTPTGVMAPCYNQYKFILPESVQSASKVMVKISPRTLDLAWPESNAYNAALNSFNATSTLKHGHIYGFEDVMVTTVK